MKIHKLTKGNSTVRFRIGKTDAEMKRQVDGKEDTTTTTLTPVEATLRMNDLIRQGYRVITGNTDDPKAVIRKPVCFATITALEWHLDLSLVPEKHQAVARQMFLKQAQGTADMCLVYNHEGEFVQLVKPPPGHLIEIGVTVS